MNAVSIGELRNKCKELCPRFGVSIALFNRIPVWFFQHFCIDENIAMHLDTFWSNYFIVFFLRNHFPKEFLAECMIFHFNRRRVDHIRGVLALAQLEYRQCQTDVTKYRIFSGIKVYVCHRRCQEDICGLSFRRSTEHRQSVRFIRDTENWRYIRRLTRNLIDGTVTRIGPDQYRDYLLAIVSTTPI